MSHYNDTECPFCEGGILHEDVRDQEYVYQKHTLLLQQPGVYCNSCDESILESEHLKVTRITLQEFKARIDGILGPIEIKRIRKRIGLNQKEAGNIFGGGKNAFSRYEQGEIAPPKSISLLFRLFNKNPSLMDDIREVETI